MYGSTIWISLSFAISVCQSFVNGNSITCEADATNAIDVKWSVDENAEYYIVTWYSMTEYHSVMGPDAVDFRAIVSSEYEDDLKVYYGLDYAQAFEDVAIAATIQSYGYIIRPGGNEEEVILTSNILTNSTYDVSVRVKGRSTNVTLLKCRVTTKAIGHQTSSKTSTSSSSNFELDPIILYVVIPGTVMSLLTITFMAVLLNRRWRKKILGEKTPVRMIASRESDNLSQITVSMGYSSDSRPSTSDSFFGWPKKNKVGSSAPSLKNRKKTRKGRYRHFVITPPETYLPSSSPILNNEVAESDGDDSYDEDDPFDRLHHRHSLTTVTEESDSSDGERKRRERCARFSAKTCDSRLTSRECSFVTYMSYTPISRDHSDIQYEHSNATWTATERKNVWTTLSSHPSSEDQLSKSCWYEENKSDYSVRDSEFYQITREERRKRKARRRPWIDRRQRRVAPSVLHVEPLLLQSESVLQISDEGSRLLGHPGTAERGVRRNPTPAVGASRQGTPAVDKRHQFTYISPHVHHQPQQAARGALRTTKSSRNILFG